MMASTLSFRSWLSFLASPWMTMDFPLAPLFSVSWMFCRIHLQNFSSSSTKMAFLPIRLAMILVEPVPARGSRIVSPGLVKVLISQRSIRRFAFAGCWMLDSVKYFFQGPKPRVSGKFRILLLGGFNLHPLQVKVCCELACTLST